MAKLFHSSLAGNNPSLVVTITKKTIGWLWQAAKRDAQPSLTEAVVPSSAKAKKRAWMSGSWMTVIEHFSTVLAGKEMG